MKPETKTGDTPVEILIVEDSPTQSMRLQNTLESRGFRVRAARNGRLALEALASRRPTLVITDIQMPEMDGYELCRGIKADAALANIPVMLLTSLAAPQDIIRGLECGADNFVVKPYEEEFLISRIQTILVDQALRNTAGPEGEITIFFAGEKYVIASDRRQVLNLLLTTYETAVNTNRDLIEAHEALKAAQSQLIEAEKWKSVGRLASGVAHEVRNPLAIMGMGISILSDQSTSEESSIILHEMKEAVEQADRVIADLMDLSSPDEYGMREAGLNALLENSLETLRDRLEQTGVEVQRNLDGDLPSCCADVSKIEQVFLNVLTNACDAMPGGGTLTVASYVKTVDSAEAAFDEGNRANARLRAGDRAIVIEVDDTGTGIAPENLTKLFEPFFSTKPTGKGMGLGLTVARKIVDLHGGKIKVSNRDRGGAKVAMIFPCMGAGS